MLGSNQNVNFKCPKKFYNYAFLVVHGDRGVTLSHASSTSPPKEKEFIPPTPFNAKIQMVPPNIPRVENPHGVNVPIDPIPVVDMQQLETLRIERNLLVSDVMIIYIYRSHIYKTRSNSLF